MKKSHICIPLVGISLLIIAALFFVSLMMQIFPRSSASQSFLNTVGNLIFGAYRFSSFLIPIYLFIAGISCFTFKWTDTTGFIFFISFIPFFTIVLTEKFCMYVATNGTNLLASFFLIVLICAVALLLLIFEYTLAIFVWQKIQQLFLSKNTAPKKSPTKKHLSLPHPVSKPERKILPLVEFAPQKSEDQNATENQQEETLQTIIKVADKEIPETDAKKIAEVQDETQKSPDAADIPSLENLEKTIPDTTHFFENTVLEKESEIIPPQLSETAVQEDGAHVQDLLGETSLEASLATPPSSSQNDFASPVEAAPVEESKNESEGTNQLREVPEQETDIKTEPISLVLTDYPSSHSDSAKAPEKNSQDDTGENLLNDSDTDLKNVPRNDLEGVASENQESVPTEPLQNDFFEADFFHNAPIPEENIFSEDYMSHIQEEQQKEFIRQQEKIRQERIEEEKAMEESAALEEQPVPETKPVVDFAPIPDYSLTTRLPETKNTTEESQEIADYQEFEDTSPDGIKAETSTCDMEEQNPYEHEELQYNTDFDFPEIEETDDDDSQDEENFEEEAYERALALTELEEDVDSLVDEDDEEFTGDENPDTDDFADIHLSDIDITDDETEEDESYKVDGNIGNSSTKEDRENSNVQLSPTHQENQNAYVERAVPHTPRGIYKIPTEGLLNSYAGGEYWLIDDDTITAAQDLKNTLNEFKIQAEVTGIKKGPVITMFEILPAPGVKLSKIVALQDNIALRLAASSVRIVAPIPGKHAVGIEVPNKERAIVSFKEIIETDTPAYKKYAIPVILGKDITGEARIFDLAKTPHLLIAGSTGSGKSVCVNTMILSILYKRSPQEVRMILIDPKIVELKLYNDIPHLLTPVITEPKKAFQALQYCICEMERRYALLDGMGVREITSYNKRIVERKIAAEKLPYIVVIIDEFADLMATTGKELESTVARLAAMSRAVGIHLVLATQRPSIDVITGLIKANIPSRIAFMVASKTDSRIIIDQVGAEKLLGKGDMLYASATDPFPIRIQGTFVSDTEVENVVEYVKQYGEPEYIDDEIFVEEEEFEMGPSLFGDGEDPLYDQALEIVLQAGKASASYIQRRLKIGYNRAARLVEEMEQRGIVGPANGSKPRDVLQMP